MIRFVTDSKPQKPLCLVLGNFDGIHLGHQSLLECAVACCRDGHSEPALMILDPHPRELFHPEWPSQRIQSLEQTVALASCYGARHLLVFPFNLQTCQLRSHEFVHFMLENLKVSSLVVGDNYRFGKNRQGDPERLRSLTDPLGIELHVCRHIEDANGVLSSTRIRDLICQGNLQDVAEMLGRPYFLEGKVRRGLQMGRELGIPTANLDPPNLLLPKTGVYATWTFAAQGWHPSLTNIGSRPTEGSRGLGIETHLVDREMDLYDQHVLIAFGAYIREEKAFASFNELTYQIGQDIEQRKTMEQRPEAFDLLENYMHFR